MDSMNPDGDGAGPKRRLIVFLLALDAAALLAAAFLAARGGRGLGAGRTPGSELLALGGRESVGWVSLRGPIASSDSGRPWERGAEQTARRIERLADEPGVKAIVLDINTPGGSVGAVQELYSRILRVRREKHIPVVALFDDVAASGGYYVASACDRIVAHPGTLTGSIGVIFEFSNLEGLFRKIGLKMEPIKSGAHKDIGSPARAMTPEERRILQALINDAYGQFLAAVSQGRHIPLAELRPLADGRIFSGTQALSLHLVDQLGDSRDAIRLAARLGGIKSEHPSIRRDVDPWDEFFGMLDSKASSFLGLGASLPLPPALTGASPRGLLYLWPGD